MGLNPMTGILIRRDTETQTQTERETEIMLLHDEEHQGQPETTRSWKEARKDSWLEPSEGAWPCLYLDLRLRASRTLREYISVV